MTEGPAGGACRPEGGDAVGRSAVALDRLLELVVLLESDMNADAARRGLSPARAHALWVLAERGPSTQRVLAEALRVSARNVTGLVDGLVETGFVTREPHPEDRRATLVSFTERGRTAVDELRREHAELAGLLFGGMTERRLGTFVSTLEDLLATVRREIGKG